MAFWAPEVPDFGIYLERYGLGVPAVLSLVGLALFSRAFGGIIIFYQMTTYGKFGVVVIVALSIVSLWLSGYTYAKVDKRRWVKTEEEDKPELVEEPDEAQ